MTSHRSIRTAALLTAGALSLSAMAAPAFAGDLEFVVRSANGAPTPNAVVTVYPSQGPHTPAPGSAPLVMEQKDVAFAPFVLVAPMGATVTFPNRDTVRHHVYSFSPTHRFELKLYGKEEQRTERFDKAGVVSIGCNIHDRMAAFIDVVDTRFAARTDAEGRVRITGLPAGVAEVKVWHPWAKAPGGLVSKSVTLAAGPTRDGLSLDLRNAPLGKQDH